MNKVTNLLLDGIVGHIKPHKYDAPSTYGVMYLDKETYDVHIRVSKYHDENSYANLTYYDTIPNFSTINSIVPLGELHNVYVELTNILLPTFKKDFELGEVSSIQIAEILDDRVELYINLS